MPLTPEAVRDAAPGDKPRKLSDEHGLYLHVKPAGSYWRWDYRFGGKRKTLALGTIDLSHVQPRDKLAAARKALREARERMREARKLLDDGTDPGAQRKQEKIAKRTAAANTFAALAEAWFTKKSAEWAPATKDKARFYLDSDLLPALGATPIASIRRPELAEVLRKMEKRGAHNAAKKCRGWLSGVFRYALVSGAIESNPATDLDVIAAAAPKSRRMPHLPSSELPGFLRALDAYAGEPGTRIAICLLLLTAARPGELRAAYWPEFDLDRATWSIPGERMKMRRPHVVPLPSQAVAALRELQLLTGSEGLLLPSRDRRSQPISENTMNVAIARMGYKGRQTSHGFRHLISTALNERGFNKDWIERQLSHGSGDEIRDRYNGAQYLDQRRQMMQAWADHLDRLREGGNVIAGNFGKATGTND